MHIVVIDKRVRISVNGTLLVDYVEEAPPIRRKQDAGRVLSHGTFALQCHDPESKVFYKSIMVKPLPDELDDGVEPPIVDDIYRQIIQLHGSNFPLVDLHGHLKGGLTIGDLLEHSRKTGINYGVAVNCGLDFPIKTDDGVNQFYDEMKGRPVFLAMQAEGREWRDLFSKEAINKFDYVFTDSMTFTTDAGKRIHIWMNDEVEIDDKQAFMDMYINRILSVMNNEPIDVFVNPTFLPEVIADEYDALWTDERMQKVIDAAVKNHVAIEINARYRIPSMTFIKKAKQAGVKFTFGTNNTGAELGRLEYCLDVLKECKLTHEDMYLPNRIEIQH